MITRKFGRGQPPTGAPSLGWSIVVVVAFLLGAASIVHNIRKTDLTLPSVESPAGPTKQQVRVSEQEEDVANGDPFGVSGVSLSLLTVSVIACNVSSSLALAFACRDAPSLSFSSDGNYSLGRFSRQMLGVSRSALAVVVFHLLFMWGVYIAMIHITKSLRTRKVGFENDLPGNLVINTLLFSVLQLLWQVVFLMWDIYCICANIKTDGWINWKKFPGFQLVMQPHPGISELKGIAGNIRDFLNPQEYSLHLSDALS